MCRTALLTVALAALPAMAVANDHNIPSLDKVAPPVWETFFMPREDGMSYTMRYVNLQTSGSVPADGSEQLDIGVVSWSTSRTPNIDCTNIQEALCSDTITVYPPEGYIAIPNEVTATERTFVDILIVPELFS